MTAPEGILCSKSHEYVLEDGSLYTIGLTDYAVEQLGDIVFVELPEVGATFGKGEVFSTVESVKAASEVYAPIGGTVVEINEKLVEAPETLNNEPYGEGWLIKVESDTASLDSGDLLEYNDYKEELV
ncbi:glycine cleavage system protein GcvH [bacterium]|nr:glycine cleavage system protein GcvH [bacterium]